MYYKCRSCQEEKYLDGCLPGTTCGLLLMVNLGISLGSAIPITQRLVNHTGWWAWFALLPLVVILFLALTFIPEFLEWLCAMNAACSRCGKRQWSWPFTRGFGL